MKLSTKCGKIVENYCHTLVCDSGKLVEKWKTFTLIVENYVDNLWNLVREFLP